MAYLNVIALDRAQAKIEAVRGTAETTMTRWITGLSDGCYFSIDQSHDETTEMTQAYQPYNDLQLLGRKAKINLEMVVTYEELIWWLNHFSKGGALTGTTTGSTPPGYTYANTPSATTDGISTSTWKIGDGATCYKLSRAVVNTATIRANIAQEGTWRMTVELLAIFNGTSSFDSPTALTRTKIISYGSKVYLDTASAIGTTVLTGRVRSFAITYQLNIEEKQFTDTGLDMAADFGRGFYIVTADLPLEHIDDTQYALARANTAVKLRFEQTGAQIGVTPTTNFRVRIDLPQAKLRLPTAGRAGVNRIMTYPVLAVRPTGASAVVHEVVTSAASVAA